MIKLISFKNCPFVQRVTGRLEAQHVPYAIEFIQLNDKPQWFLDISPNGQVPVLMTETGTPLFESDAIIEYLDEVYGPIEANLDPEQRAMDRAWNYQASKLYLPQCSAMSSKDKDTLEERATNLGKVFAKVEEHLGDGPLFKGASISNVDIAWLPLLHRADIIRKRTGYDFVDKYPKLKAWQQALMATGIAEKSVAKDFEEVFSSYYLSDKTYLGNPNAEHQGSKSSFGRDGCC